jgi:aspartyl/asparaginyl beta-hydroxylase (cupin superfamily)
MEPAHYRIYSDYAGQEPAFYDAEQFPWTESLRRNWHVIREEFDAYVAQGRALKPNFAPDAVELTGWVGVNFFTYLRRYNANCRAFPRTVALLESIPNLASAFINLLEPHCGLPPHYGETNVAYRVHMGLVVPGGVEECGIQVDSERRGWGEGEVLVFNDARKHFVWNRSDRPRVILVCDVMKPQYGGATPGVCGRVLGSIVVMFAQARLPWLRRLPARVLRAFHAAASVPFQAYLLVFGNQRRGGAALAYRRANTAT